MGLRASREIYFRPDRERIYRGDVPLYDLDSWYGGPREDIDLGDSSSRMCILTYLYNAQDNGYSTYVSVRLYITPDDASGQTHWHLQTEGGLKVGAACISIPQP